MRRPCATRFRGCRGIPGPDVVGERDERRAAPVLAQAGLRHGCRRRALPGHAARALTTDEPDTPATRWLARHDVPHQVVETQPASSAEESAEFQGIGLHQLLRTIVVRRGENDYVL